MNHCKNRINRYLHNLDLAIKKFPAYKKSFSQCGEDIVIDFVLNALRINKPTYLDVGAHHPKYLSNTYFFYLRGCYGVCIEPDPYLFLKFKRKRKRDICLNIGVGAGEKTVSDFYIMSSRTLSTFSKDEARRYQKYHNLEIEKIVEIPLVPLNDIIRTHFNRYPNILSLDVEGLELEILKSIDFKQYRPEVFCIETLIYAKDNRERKIIEISDFMNSNGYMVYADTYINTIFVEMQRWAERP